MSEHVKNFIDNLSNGNNADAGEAFKDALRAKVADGLDKQRVDVASKIFNGVEAMLIADPKPAVTDPNPETDVVIDTKVKKLSLLIMVILNQHLSLIQLPIYHHKMMK